MPMPGSPAREHSCPGPESRASPRARSRLLDADRARPGPPSALPSAYPRFPAALYGHCYHQRRKRGGCRLCLLRPRGRRHCARGRRLRTGCGAGHRAAPLGVHSGSHPFAQASALLLPTPPQPSSAPSPGELAHPAGGKGPPSGRTKGLAGREGTEVGTRGRGRGPSLPGPPT